MELKKNTICIICNEEQRSFNQLHRHVQLQHSLDIETYYIKLLHGGIQPTCACGCKEPVTFFKNTRSFGVYKQGHISRIKNNWGHNKDVLDKSHQTMREKRAKGEHPAWNKGLTKETDERVAAYSKVCSKNILEDDDERKKRSIQMANQRASGNILTLYGPDTSRWKGGTSSLNAAVNSSNQLYKEWKFPKLQAANFKCTRCSSTQDLCVHHDKEKMSTIIHLHVEKMGYDASTSSHELKTTVIEAIVDYHIKNDVSGIVLCYACHELEHNSLNFKKQQSLIQH